MRIILFYDLPVLTSEQRREYRRFNSNLIKNGYIMIQESVYVKLITNYNAREYELEKLDKIKPKSGMIQCLVITEKQYTGIINISGKIDHPEIDSMERVIVI